MSNNPDLIYQTTDGVYCSPGKGSVTTGMVNSVSQGRTHFSSGQRLQCTLHFPQLSLQCQGPRGIDRVTWQRRRRQRGDLIVQPRLLSYMRLSPHFARAYRLAHRQHKLLQQRLLTIAAQTSISWFYVYSCSHYPSVSDQLSTDVVCVLVTKGNFSHRSYLSQPVGQLSECLTRASRVFRGK